MVINDHAVSRPGTDARHETKSARGGIIARMLTWMAGVYCGLHGHDTLMQFARNRVYLQCASCGHETPGWSLNGAPPRVTERVKVRRPGVHRPIDRYAAPCEDFVLVVSAAQRS